MSHTYWAHKYSMVNPVWSLYMMYCFDKNLYLSHFPWSILFMTSDFSARAVITIISDPNLIFWSLNLKTTSKKLYRTIWKWVKSLSLELKVFYWWYIFQMFTGQKIIFNFFEKMIFLKIDFWEIKIIVLEIHPAKMRMAMMQRQNHWKQDSLHH